MRRRRTATIEDLRAAVDGLPRRTKIAMLEGVRTNDIIVGAYSSGGGICPMLAAHRAGGRTSFISFARAWDRFAFRDSRSRPARRATERELRILTSQLEASLLTNDEGASDLSAAVRHHRQLLQRRRADAPPEPASGRAGAKARPTGRARPGDPDPSPRLRDRPGWAWTRVVRRYDEYERVLERLEAERALCLYETTAAQPEASLEPRSELSAAR
jgi:hypothetical protein